MPDKITERLFSRDERALFEIEEKHGRFLLSLSRRIVGSPEDAEEILNDVLLEIWNTVPPKSPESILSYACMLVRRASLGRVRYNTAGKRGGGEYPIPIDELSELLFSEERYDDGEITELINSFLATQKKKQRIIFMSRYFGFESSEDIAKKMSVSKNSVDVCLSRMRKELKNYLEKRGFTI